MPGEPGIEGPPGMPGQQGPAGDKGENGEFLISMKPKELMNYVYLFHQVTSDHQV